MTANSSIGNKFISLQNIWTKVDSFFTCCELNCIKENLSNGICGNGHGVVRVNGGVLKYIKSIENEYLNKAIVLYADRAFRRIYADNSRNSLFYYEIKITEAEDLEECYFQIGLKNNLVDIVFSDKSINYDRSGQNRMIYVHHDLNINDTFGIGLVYTPVTGRLNDPPYVFCTINGNKSGKAILLESNDDSLFPKIWIELCSIKTMLIKKTFYIMLMDMLCQLKYIVMKNGQIFKYV